MRRHVCDQNCKYSIYGVCSFTGKRHVCTGHCLTEGEDGEMVCRWTGIVAQTGGNHIERSLQANSTRRNRAEEAGGYKRQAQGYLMPSQKRHETGPGNQAGRRRLLPGNAGGQHDARQTCRHVSRHDSRRGRTHRPVDRALLVVRVAQTTRRAASLRPARERRSQNETRLRAVSHTRVGTPMQNSALARATKETGL